MNNWNATLYLADRLVKELFRRFARYLTWLTFFLTGGPIRVNPRRIRNLTGPAIVIANHKSVFDPALVHYILADRNARFITKTVFVKVPHLGQLITWLEAFPIDPTKRRSLIDVFEKACSLLRSGEIVAFFPEGKMVMSDEIGRIGGLALDLALETGAPIYCLGMRHVNRVFPGARLWPKHWARLTIALSGPHVFYGRPVGHDKRIAIEKLRRELSVLSGYPLSS